MDALPLLNPEGVSEAEAATYKRRAAARAIVMDTDGNMALLHATTHHYYKLPGGGVEPGEVIEEALLRECKEEIGCDVEIVGEVASLTEYRKKLSLHQTSYCYMARLVGEKGTPSLEADEIEHGMETVWVPIHEARRLVKASALNVYEAAYMVARDVALIDAAEKMVL